MGPQHYPFTLIPLPYEYSAMEPYIDTRTMTVHHNKHLQAYIDKLNAALEPCPQFHSWTLELLIYNIDCLPEKRRTEVKNNAGGVYNHNFFFAGLANNDIKAPIGDLKFAIDRDFGGYDEFKSKMKAAAMSVFGSGYAWLVVDMQGCLQIVTTANQDTTFEKDLCPVITLDVWEHAYYLKHLNLRADYIDDWFNVINWQQADQNYQSCRNLAAARRKQNMFKRRMC